MAIPVRCGRRGRIQRLIAVNPGLDCGRTNERRYLRTTLPGEFDGNFDSRSLFGNCWARRIAGGGVFEIGAPTRAYIERCARSDAPRSS